MASSHSAAARTQTLPDHLATDPTLSAVAPDRVVWRWVLGVVVKFETNDQRIENAAMDLLGPELLEDARAADIVLRVMHHHVDEPSRNIPDEPVIREQEGLFTVAASRATFVSGDATRGIAMGFVSETVAASTDYLRSAIVQAAFLTLVKPRVHGAIHAACIVKDGRSVMLRGEEGAGKSTTAFVALRAGFSLVAEDVVFPRLAGNDQCVVHGLPWSLSLLPDAERFFPELRGLPRLERYNGEVKVSVQVDSMFPSQWVTSAPIGPTVFITRSRDGGSHLVPLGIDETILALTYTSIEYERRAAAQHGLWDAILRYPAYRMEIGPDPFGAIPLLEEIVRSQTGQCR